MRVDAGLLERARAGEPADSLARDLRTAVADLASAGASVVVCTCSTLGPLAERIGRDGPVPVLRVDRPMADRAVRTPPDRLGEPVRVLVVIALGSTLGSTTDLLVECATTAGRAVDLAVLRCDSAWPLFEAGHPEAFVESVADAVRTAVAPPGEGQRARADVVVLAQASMAAAADRLAGLGVPVLASPRAAVRHALDLARGDAASAVSG